MGRGPSGGFRHLPHSSETNISRGGGLGNALIIGSLVGAGFLVHDDGLDAFGDRGSTTASIEKQVELGDEYEQAYQEADLAGRYVMSYINPPFDQDLNTGKGPLGFFYGTISDPYEPYGTDNCLVSTAYDVENGAEISPTEFGLVVTPAYDGEMVMPETHPRLALVNADGAYGDMAPADEVANAILRDQGCEIEKFNITQPDF